MPALRALRSQRPAIRSLHNWNTTRNVLNLTQRYSTQPGPAPNRNPYPSRSSGLLSKLRYRADGTPRPMRNAALVLLVTSLAGTWFLSPSKEKRKAEAVKHCLAALSQIEELDHTYSQRDFTSFEGTKEYFFRLARIVLDSVDAHGSPTKALNKAETTIQKAQLHRAEHPELRTALDWVTAKYLDVVHGIMKDCAETIHEGLKMEAPREGIGASVIVTLLTACDVVVKLSFAVNTVDEKVLENITIEEFVARREKASQKQPSGELRGNSQDYDSIG